MLRIRLFIALLALALSGAWPRAAAAIGYLYSSATCADSTVVVFEWTFHDDPLQPARADWVGFDVVRRTVADCGAYVRVNAQPFVRTPGTTETFTFTEPAPAQRTLVEYHVVPVDAARQRVFPNPVECDGCALPAYVTCPDFSAPLTQGTVMDLGWALMVIPCPGSCYAHFYVPDDATLRPYVGTGTVVRVYGTPACNTLEGCAATLDHFDLAPCGIIVPALPSTWGRLKTRYR